MKDEEVKQFFLALYEDLMLFSLDKQRLTFECGNYNLVCNITFELVKNDDRK